MSSLDLWIVVPGQPQGGGNPAIPPAAVPEATTTPTPVPTIDVVVEQPVVPVAQEPDPDPTPTPLPTVPATTVTLTPSTPVPVPQQSPPEPGRLAFTGSEAGLLLLIAVVLVAVGLMIHRLTRPHPGG